MYLITFHQTTRRNSDKQNWSFPVNQTQNSKPDSEQYNRSRTEPGLTRAVGGESCPAGSSCLRQHLEAGGGAEAEEQQQSGAGQHGVFSGCGGRMRWFWFRSSVALVVLPGLPHPSTPGISIVSGRDGPIRGRRSRAGGAPLMDYSWV